MRVRAVDSHFCFVFVLFSLIDAHQLCYKHSVSQISVTWVDLRVLTPGFSNVSRDEKRKLFLRI